MCVCMRWSYLTFVAVAHAPAVHHGLPGEQVIVADGPQPLDALLLLALLLPRLNLLEESLGGLLRRHRLSLCAFDDVAVGRGGSGGICPELMARRASACRLDDQEEVRCAGRQA